MMLPALALAASLSAADGFVESLQNARILERFQCVEVHAYHAERIDPVTIAVDVDGRGITWRGRELPLPRRWYLSPDGSAQTEEERIAMQLLETPGDAARERIVEAHAEYERPALGGALAEAAVELHRRNPDPHELLIAEQDAVGYALRLVLAGDDRSATTRAWHAAALLIGYEPRFAARAVETARGENDCDDLALALLTAGNVVSNRVDLDQGSRLLRESASLVGVVDDPRVPLRALHNYAVQQQQRGAVPRAFDAALLLAREARRYGWREGEAAAKIDVAEAYIALQRDDAAAPELRGALELLRAEGNEGWSAQVLFTLAAAEMRLGDETRGVAHYEEALRLSRTKVGGGIFVKSLVEYARALAEAGRIADARKPLREALALRPEIGGDLAAELAAVRLAQHRDREALELARKSIATVQSEYHGDTLWRAETLAGRASARLGRRRAAIASFRRAIEVIEARRAATPADELARQRYFMARLEPYHALIGALLDDGRPRDALAMAERIKARTLLDTLTFGRAGLTHEVDRADAAREKALEAAVAHWRSQRGRASRARLEAARRDLDELRAKMRWRFPAAAVQADDLDPLRALAALPRDAAVLELVIDAEQTTLFVATREGVRARRIAVPRAAVARAARELHDAVASRRLDWQLPAAAFARRFLAPVAPWLAHAGRLYVVPDGAAWQVPFQLLPDARGEPLLARHEISYLPSIAVAGLRRERRAGRALLAIGSAALPDAAEEVGAIVPLYRDAEIAADGEQFLRRAPTRSVIHVAAHAEAYDDWPLESSLLLAGRTVSAEDLLRLPLRCDLAVLAACNTAAGHARDGEGMVGLSWALLGAGSANAVVSQWSVDSAATRRLMAAFHRGYAGGLPPPAALRSAELAMRGEHPFYWAPFIVIASRW